MNYGVIILCKDKIFSRMIEIELKKAGCLIMPKNSTEEGFIVYIRDVDTKTIEVLSNKNQSDKRLFTRPFYVKDFVNYISILLKNQDTKPSYVKIADTSAEASDELAINVNKRSVTFKNKEVFLTKREFDLLLYLYENRGNPVSRDEAISNVWKYDFTGDTNIVDVYIRYLRGKLDDKFNTKLIYTVRNKGYMIK